MPAVTTRLTDSRRFTATLFACLVLGGCSLVDKPSPSTPLSAQPAESTAVPVIRASRYTLMNTLPAAEQKDLLSQIIDIRILDNASPTVSDALAYALRRSGYQLCAGKGNVSTLFAHPLPASHYRLGPTPLRDALQVLAGPAWILEVDEISRTVCFSTRVEYRRPAVTSALGER